MKKFSFAETPGIPQFFFKQDCTRKIVLIAAKMVDNFLLKRTLADPKTFHVIIAQKLNLNTLQKETIVL